VIPISTPRERISAPERAEAIEAARQLLGLPAAVEVVPISTPPFCSPRIPRPLGRADQSDFLFGVELKKPESSWLSLAVPASVPFMIGVVQVLGAIKCPTYLAFLVFLPRPTLF
jgi:hypothetical protein